MAPSSFRLIVNESFPARTIVPMPPVPPQGSSAAHAAPGHPTTAAEVTIKPTNSLTRPLKPAQCCREVWGFRYADDTTARSSGGCAPCSSGTSYMAYAEPSACRHDRRPSAKRPLRARSHQGRTAMKDATTRDYSRTTKTATTMRSPQESTPSSRSWYGGGRRFESVRGL